MKNSSNEKPSCCKKIVKKENRSFLAGVAYGVIPHIGCIAFIVFTILGVTAATTLFKPLLLNPYFFYILIALSLVFATISATVYLKKNGMLSPSGIKRKWRYLSTMYGSTIGVNLFLFMLIFPLLANVSAASPPITGAVIGVVKSSSDFSSLKLSVGIPCPGHAPLISNELKSINGLVDVRFSFPNVFDVKYDPTKTSKQEILSLDVFNTYKAIVVEESSNKNQNQLIETQPLNNQPATTCGCGGCSGGCGGCGVK